MKNTVLLPIAEDLQYAFPLNLNWQEKPCDRKAPFNLMKNTVTVQKEENEEKLGNQRSQSGQRDGGDKIETLSAIENPDHYDRLG